MYLFLSKGGKLLLSNKRLLFLDHGLNLTAGGVSIELKDIMSVDTALTVSIFMLLIPVPNAIKVRTQDGLVHRFTVFGRKKWVEDISKAMNS